MNSNLKRSLVVLLTFLILTLKANPAAQTIVDQLITSLSKEIPTVWTYKDSFPDTKSLQLDKKCFDDGIAVDGKMTRDRIIKMVQSAINKRNVYVFVLGGSSTIGADLGINNLKLTYHYALADWWNKTIGSITGSHMHRKVVAVGGVGTTYFGHCWQEYVNEKDEFDYVTWEFAINDPDSLQYEKAVERFARDVLSMKSMPGLTFVNFASRSALTSGPANKCKRHENEAKIVDSFAKHYLTTSVRWERGLCSCRKFNSKKDLANLFTRNHPKVIGHAQVSYMLINYFKKVILRYLKDYKREVLYRRETRHSIDKMMKTGKRNVFQNDNIASKLPEPIYMTKDDVNIESKCYTSISPGPTNPPKSSLTSLTVLQNQGFTILKESPWDSVPEERFDTTGGYITQFPGKNLKLQFHVSKGPNPFSQISVTVRNKYFGGKVKFILDEGTPNEKIVHADTSERKKAGTNSIELGPVPEGTHTISVHTETGGCNICAVIID